MSHPVYKRRRVPRWRPSVQNIGTALFVVALAACAGHANLPNGSGSPATSSADSFTGVVTRVVDGDTFRLSSQDARNRVWGLDAPMRDRAGGSRATAALTATIDGKRLSCRQRDIDRYGRIVGQCFLADSRDIAAAMIASGTAREYCRYSGNHYRTC